MRRKYLLYSVCAFGGVVLMLIAFGRQLPDHVNYWNVMQNERYTKTTTLTTNKISHSCFRDDSEESENSQLRDIQFSEFIKGPLQQNDSRIADFILRNGYIHSPASSKTLYNLTTPPNVDPSVGQSGVIKKLMNYKVNNVKSKEKILVITNGKRNGFFIECGALDGETRSNTLSLERDYGWRGLLVEGDPSNFELILTKRRKAWAANCCLSIHSYPHQVKYQQDFNTGKISLDESDRNSVRVEDDGTSKNATMTNVQCFPLFSLLSAINVTTVDYFSLDVEGHELAVLKTIPFHLLYIKLLSVEFIHDRGGAESLETFMQSKGYRVVAKVRERHWLANDLIFAHKSFQVTTKSSQNTRNI